MVQARHNIRKDKDERHTPNQQKNFYIIAPLPSSQPRRSSRFAAQDTRKGAGRQGEVEKREEEFCSTTRLLNQRQ